MFKRLVIDTDLAQSYGSSDAERSACVRNFFKTVLQETEHKVVISEPLLEEWSRHETIHFKRWRSQMYGRRRFVKVVLSKNESLFKRIAGQHSDKNIQHAIKKDFHLVQAALQTDKMIISLERKMRTYLVKSAKKVNDIRDIIWFNPHLESSECLRWLSEGCRDHQKNKLG